MQNARDAKCVVQREGTGVRWISGQKHEGPPESEWDAGKKRKTGRKKRKG